MSRARPKHEEARLAVGLIFNVGWGCASQMFNITRYTLPCSDWVRARNTNQDTLEYLQYYDVLEYEQKMEQGGVNVKRLRYVVLR